MSSFMLYMMVDFGIDPLEDLIFSDDPGAQLQIEQRIQDLNLDATAVERYIDWLGSFITGDMGTNWRTGRPVSELLQGAVLATIRLVSAATVLAIILGVGIGVVSALRQYTSFDYVIIFVCFVLYSLPVFWVAVLLKQWGAIGYNDFLEDPSLPIWMIGLVAAIFGALVMLAVAGSPQRRVVTFLTATAAASAVLAYLMVTDWWNHPHVGPVWLAITGLGIAFAITILTAGLENRRALFTTFTVVAIGLAMYYPLQPLLNNLTTSEATWPGSERELLGWPLLALMGLLAILVGWAVGRAWGGPDWKQSARSGAIVAFLVSGVILLDRFFQAWPDYMTHSRVNNRPIRTIGESIPGFDADFWVTTLNTYSHLVLPTLSLTLISFASYTRFARGTMLEVLNQDYMRTARAKGLTDRTVIMRHGFRNTLIPLATLVPVDVITLLNGAIITERIFARPGMGTLFLDSFAEDVIDPVMAYLVITGFLVVFANFIADLCYAALDPRIRVNA
ncbi:ABC transporter permease [Bogoriella caseilytica]|uniref:ABC transporter permease n=1 Tax=Bogoriella caseilytica TaxID=56055 RepID=UPI001FE95EDF|nr:ABC transporter permease [Bogoriella caseilytica]